MQKNNRKHLVIFLDIDGVMNSAPFLTKHTTPYGIAIVGSMDGVEGIDPKAVDLLNTLVEESGANIVISSSWRFGHTIITLQSIFNRLGFKFPERIIGSTSDLPGKSRGEEISLWLKQVPVDAFIILDDDTDMKGVRDHHIKTDFNKGLLQEHVTRALEMFKSQMDGGSDDHKGKAERQSS